MNMISYLNVHHAEQFFGIFRSINNRLPYQHDLGHVATFLFLFLVPQ